MKPQQLSLMSVHKDAETEVPLVAQDWYHCKLCGVDFQKDEQGLHIYTGAIHQNVCRRFKCSKCAHPFSLLPNPLLKRYGSQPLCEKCYADPIPTQHTVAVTPPPKEG